MPTDSPDDAVTRQWSPNIPSPIEPIRAAVAVALAPGVNLASRYRIIALLGKGGMGHVYRADDLTLGSSVALKFLPPEFVVDPLRLERFKTEVRLTRQISHPNVCRVYDLAEIPDPASPGLPLVFLSMEYIDGEDLASLLRRIGRVPHDKAVQIARQICFGLAAAHDQHVIHRDLKPANIMLDGRGNARITDFGVAGLAHDLASRQNNPAGTPLYMAPEQLAGGEVTTRSDVYSLGLVLYEIFTGKPAYTARSLDELRRLHDTGSRPPSPSSHTQDIDPAVERVILRCLEKDPADRPSSAIAVAAALPGGDPLAAAIAAGETPSPELVAASGGVEGCRTSTGLLCLVACALLGAAMLFLGGRADLTATTRAPNSPDALSAKAREILRTLGYTDKPGDWSAGYQTDPRSLEVVRNSGLPLSRQAQLLATQTVKPITFFYRQSPRPIPRTSLHRPVPGLDEPPQWLSGSATVALDMEGRLVALWAVPPQITSVKPTAQVPDWNFLFTAAGLEFSRFQPVEPTRAPPHASTVRAAWLNPTHSELGSLRIEGAAEGSLPTYFELIYSFSTPSRMVKQEPTVSMAIHDGVMAFVVYGVTLAAFVIALINLRAGRGDRQGAFRVALVVLVASWLAMILSQPRLARAITAEPLDAIAVALWTAGSTWVLYIASEPLARRFVPRLLISWSRFITGRFTDPLVARDILAGVTAAFLVSAVYHSQSALDAYRFGPAAVFPVGLDLYSSARVFTGHFLAISVNAVVWGFEAMIMLVGSMLILRKLYLAALVPWSICLMMLGFNSPDTVTNVLINAVGASIFTFVVLRFGALSTVAMLLAWWTLTSPMTTDSSSWFAEICLAAIAVPFLIAVAAFCAPRIRARALAPA